MGVFAHMFQGCLKSRGVLGGLTKDRHLWRFLADGLNPQSFLWEHLAQDREVFALSTDLSEATDYGNRTVARQVWMQFIRLAKFHKGFPLGLAVLAMNLYCGTRFVIYRADYGWSYIRTTRGWFMGDMMTKVILTVVHDYTMRLSGLQVYSLVGDDEVALSNSYARLARHLHHLRQVGFMVSDADTFISSRLLFYCEEGALVPQRPTHALHVRMRRNQELGYLDYPRIRLLLACYGETDTYSASNVGRFDLLGKESRWVSSNNPRAVAYFQKATLLQAALVPQDSDTLCPFIPIEIGGNGAYYNSPSFMNKIIHDRSRDARETLWRMSSLVSGTFGFRLVRSERLNEVVHKHHIIAPALDAMRQYLPEEAVISFENETQRTLLESVRVRGLESPTQTWVRLSKSLYWNQMFQGRQPALPSFGVSRSFSKGHDSDPKVDLYDFLQHWRNPGFTFKNHSEYFVLRDKVQRIDPLNLGWSWQDLSALNYPAAFHIYSEWMNSEVDFGVQDFESVIDLIVRGQPLPDRIVRRLNLYMESDNYILNTLPQEFSSWYYGIVSRDWRLCANIRRVLSHRAGHNVLVYCFDPAPYLIGRMEDVVDWRHHPEIPERVFREDPGAVLHVDYTEFTDGWPHMGEAIFDTPLECRETRHSGVFYISFAGV